MQIQISEALVLTLGVAFAPVVLSALASVDLPGKSLFRAAYLGVVVGAACTIIEGAVLYEFFNLLEHASHAIAGTLTAAALWSARNAWAPGKRGT